MTLPGVSVVSVPSVDQSPIATLFQYDAPAFALSEAATIVTPASATISGTVNAAGTASTACVEYGAISGGGAPAVQAAAGAKALSSFEPQDETGLSYPSQTNSVSVGSGTSNVPLALNLTGLASSMFYHYRVALTNGAGTTYGADQVFTTSQAPFDIWEAQQFSASDLEDSTISGETAEPAGDGVRNLLKYALGLNAQVNAASGLPVAGTAVVNGTNCLTFSYTKMDSATDITYEPQWSSDLATWSNSGLVETVISDNGTRQQVQDAIPMSTAQRIFFKLTVTMP